MRSKLTWHSLFILFLCFSISAAAQKPYEGTITYDVSYLNLPDGQSGKEAALPSRLRVYVQGQNLRIQQYTSLAGEWTTIQPADRDSSYHCFYLLDQRVMLVRQREKKAARFRVVKKDEEQDWQSFNLTAYRLQKADGGHFNAWLDERYQNPFIMDMPELKYLPLIFEMERGGVTMRLTAEDYEEMQLDESYFEVPENVERINDDILLRLLN